MSTTYLHKLDLFFHRVKSRLHLQNNPIESINDLSKYKLHELISKLKDWEHTIVQMGKDSILVIENLDTKLVIQYNENNEFVKFHEEQWKDLEMSFKRTAQL
jgi:hypothetical protein